MTDRSAEDVLAHAGWLRALALRLVRDNDLADDLVQDTLITTMQRVPEGSASAKSWLAKVMVNQLRMRARSEGRRTAREQASETPPRLIFRVPTSLSATMRSLVLAALASGSLAHADRAPLIIVDNPYRSDVTGHVSWQPLIGDRFISEEAFFDLVGRQDLASVNRRKKTIMIGAAIAGMIAAGFTAVSAVETHDRYLPDYTPCLQFGAPADCTTRADQTAATKNDQAAAPWRTGAWLGAGVTVSMIGLVLYEAATTKHMGVLEAHALADRYNATHVTPYATPQGGGVSLQGTF